MPYTHMITCMFQDYGVEQGIFIHKKTGFPLRDYRCSALIGVEAVRRLWSSTIISTPSRHLLMSPGRTRVEGSDRVWEAILPVAGHWRTVWVEDEPSLRSMWKLKRQKWLPNIGIVSQVSEFHSSDPKNLRVWTASLSFFPYIPTKGKRNRNLCHDICFYMYTHLQMPTQLFFPAELLKWQELKAYLVRQKEGPNLKRCPVWLDHGCRD